MLVCRVFETRRLAVALPRDAAAARSARIDTDRMVSDLRELASDRFEGRGAGTPGGRLAAEFVAARFASLGLRRFGGAYEQPFAFDHTSIRAIWRRDRPVVKRFEDVRNVIGYVAGTTRPDDIVVASAHFDHLGIRNGQTYHGADDNASGTAALLAIAAYVAARPLDETVVFAAFDAEELGLRGAHAFLSALPFPRERLRLDVNIDMISRSDDGRLFVAGTSHYPALLPVVEAGARASAVPVHLGHDRSIFRTGLIADWTPASDHGAFHEAGIPFLYFGVEDHPDVHEPTDTADRIDATFYGRAAGTVLETLLAFDAQ